MTDELWMTRHDIAALCGLSVRQFDEVIRPRLPAENIRGSGISLRFHASGIGPIMLEYELEKKHGVLTRRCPYCDRGLP